MQLPKRFANWLNETGQDALHTLDLPRKNLTTDNEIIARAQQDGRIVVTKDADFVRSFLITGKPLLLLISTGNMSNTALEKYCARIWPVLKPFLQPVDLSKLPVIRWWYMNEIGASLRS